MAAIPLKHDVYYPESDGEPMGETEVQIREIMDLIQTLKQRFRDAADVYVGGNMLLYYIEGRPSRRICPDVFVTVGIPKLPPRRSYFLWREGRPPSMVIEVTSEGSKREDVAKKKTHAQLGVEEYFLYDPLSEYLSPSLQGYRLAGSECRDGREYRPIPPSFDGLLRSETTGLSLRPEGERLRLVDTATGAPLLRPDEVSEAWEAEQVKLAAAEEELARLRQELDLLKRKD